MTRMPPPQPRPYLLRNRIQHYSWGTRGSEAFIPRFLGIEAEAERPYAELWMGAHPKAPSEVVVGGARVSLRELIARYPVDILGETVSKAFSGPLPFLLKVLSAAEPLSIQAHPNREQAESLHARDPEHYPDRNHKLELAVALDALTGLVGFKRFSDILRILDRYPELAGFIGQEVVRGLGASEHPSVVEQRNLTRLAYSTLVRRSITSERELAESIARLERRLSESTDALTEEEHLFLDLRRKYTGPDVGLFSIFLLNLVRLKQGQGIFITAGVPHAYLGGNIVECMTNSDNVVRVGLTPKFRDVETLLEILRYETEPVAILAGRPDARETIYHTPTPEFRVSRWNLEAGQERREVTGNRPEVMLITKGEIVVTWAGGDSKQNEEAFHRGQSLLIPASLDEVTIACRRPTEIFRVTVPLNSPPGPRRQL